MAHQVKQRLQVVVLANIVFYGFILNAIWELAQAGPLYGMWKETSLAAGLFYITLAVLSDALIVLGVTVIAAAICGPSNILSPNFKGYISMMFVGFIAGLFLEWIPKSLGWWTYSDLMPTLTIMGETVGLFPLLQVTVLPPLSVFLATKIGNPLAPLTKKRTET